MQTYALNGVVYQFSKRNVSISAVNRDDTELNFSEPRIRSICWYLIECGFSLSFEKLQNAINEWNIAAFDDTNIEGVTHWQPLIPPNRFP